jgi:hypothetical protein
MQLIVRGTPTVKPNVSGDGADSEDLDEMLKYIASLYSKVKPGD